MANKIKKTIRAGVVVASAAALCFAAPSIAAPYYDGKTITLVVAFAPGGTADTDGRMIAQHLARQIEGNPKIVVQNLPGAGGIKAINMAYQVAKPDGLSIFQLASGHFLQQLTGSDAVKFDLSKMPILGAWLHSTYVLSVRAATGMKTVEDVRKANAPLQVGTQGLGTGTYIYTVAWQKALGVKFKLVTGYEGNEQTLAMERGEIDARTDTASSIMQRSADWIKLAPPMVQNGPERDPLLPTVPTVNDVNPNPGIFWNTINSALSMDRPYVLPPNTPAEQVAELRRAWDKMLKDAAFKAEAEKRHWTIVPTSAETVEAFYKKAATSTPPDVIAELKELFP
jgi:tripartite-type tricarboxylate transporter receptor subunit TctC